VFAPIPTPTENTELSMRSNVTAWLFLAALQLEARALPQEGEAKQASTALVLSPKDHEALGKLLSQWFKAHIEFLELENQGEKANPQRKTQKREQASAAKKKFWEDAEKRSPTSKSGSILKHVADLKAIFALAFPYENAPATGEIVGRKVLVGDDKPVTAALCVPKTYTPKAAVPVLVTLPTRTEDGKRWTESKKHLETLWKGSPTLTQMIVLSPAFPDDLTLDAAVDFAKEATWAPEEDRISYVMMALHIVL
jgi:hypothetical protein